MRCNLRTGGLILVTAPEDTVYHVTGCLLAGKKSFLVTPPLQPGSEASSNPPLHVCHIKASVASTTFPLKFTVMQFADITVMACSQVLIKQNMAQFKNAFCPRIVDMNHDYSSKI